MIRTNLKDSSIKTRMEPPGSKNIKNKQVIKMEVNVKIFLKNNEFVVKLRSSHLR